MIRKALLVFGALALLPAEAAAQPRDFEFCERLTLVLSASHDAEPFSSLLPDPAKRIGYTTQAMPGFDHCYVGRFGAEPPGIATFSCRHREAPEDLTASALLQRIGVCLERQPEADETGAAFFAAPPTRVTATEEVFGDKRQVIFKVQVVPAE